MEGQANRPDAYASGSNNCPLVEADDKPPRLLPYSAALSSAEASRPHNEQPKEQLTYVAE